MKAILPSAVVIENLDDIVLAYNDGIAGRVLAKVAERLDRSLGHAAVSAIEPWGVSLDLSRYADPSVVVRQIEDAVHQACLRPIDTPQGQIVTLLSTRVERPVGVLRLSTAPRLTATEYRVAMCAAAIAYDGLSNGRLDFVEQPISSVGGGRRFTLNASPALMLKAARGSSQVPMFLPWSSWDSRVRLTSLSSRP